MFVMETGHTVWEVTVRTISIFVLSVLSVFLIADIINVLVRQQTLDVLQLFQEDQAVIRQYFGEVVNTLYIESPKLEIVSTLVLVCVVAVSVVLFLQNFERIKNKVQALKKFWSSH